MRYPARNDSDTWLQNIYHGMLHMHDALNIHVCARKPTVIDYIVIVLAHYLHQQLISITKSSTYCFQQI